VSDGAEISKRTNALPRLPSGWLWSTLGFVANVRLGKMLSRAAFAADLNQLPYLRNENVRWGWVDTSDVKTMGFKESELERYAVEPGDLLICEGGEAGRCAVYKGPSGALMYQKALHRVRPIGQLMNAAFLQFCLQYYVTSGTVVSKPSETTIQHLPLEKMLALPVPVPPAAEQDRIVAAIEEHFTRLDDAVASLQRVQANLKRYCGSVLKVACEGRLVSTEAQLALAEGRNYEPAENLLARVLGKRQATLGRVFAKMKPAPDLPQLPEGWTWARIEQLTPPARPSAYGVLQPGPTYLMVCLLCALGTSIVAGYD